MLEGIARRVSKGIRRRLGLEDAVQIRHFQRGGWLTEILDQSDEAMHIDLHKVTERLNVTREEGGKPLWSGYQGVKNYPFSTEGERTVEQVRTTSNLGRLYAWLVEQRAPDMVVEFGTAFGVSGMFWLTGIESNGSGHLTTYEPNVVWADIAEQNLKAISDRFTLHRDTFENVAATTLTPRSVDIGFIDAIHTSDFVFAQYDILRPFMKRDGIVIFDDIDFSPDMRHCWRTIRGRPEFVASAEIGNRVGIVQLGH